MMNMLRRKKNDGKKREGAEKGCSLRAHVNLTNKFYYFKNDASAVNVARGAVSVQVWGAVSMNRITEMTLPTNPRTMPETTTIR